MHVPRVPWTMPHRMSACAHFLCALYTRGACACGENLRLLTSCARRCIGFHWRSTAVLLCSCDPDGFFFNWDSIVFLNVAFWSAAFPERHMNLHVLKF